MAKVHFDIGEYEKTAKILRTVAANYPESSAEYQAIKTAALALLFACEITTFERFERFLHGSGKKLSARQKENLKKILAEEDPVVGRIDCSATNLSAFGLAKSVNPRRFVLTEAGEASSEAGLTGPP